MDKIRFADQYPFSEEVMIQKAAEEAAEKADPRERKVETIDGTVIELSEHYFHVLTPKKDTKNSARSVMSLSDFCKAKGVNFLYVNTPAKASNESDPDCCGVTDFCNQNADEFLSDLKSNNIDCCDLRDLIREDGLDYHSCFFNTDHHWHTEMGLWAAGKIVSILNNDFGFHIDPSYTDPDRYRAEIYPKFLLGIQGARAPRSNAIRDDFSLLYPEFETDLHFEIPALGIDYYGDFSIIYDMERLGKKKKCPYAAYMYGDQALEKFSNRMLDNGYRVLVVHDSFANCIIPFLAMGIQYVDSLDMRHFDGSLRTYIEKEHPDIVILIYNTAIIPGPEIILNGTFDFR